MEKLTSDSNCLNEIIDDKGTVDVHDEYENILLKNAKTRFDEMSSIIEVKKTWRVLDIGCGNGYFMKVAEEFGMDAVGIEVNSAAAKYVETRFNLPVILSHPPYKELESEYFDLVTLWGVVEHVPYPGQIIRSISRLMHPDSWLVISTPSEDALMRQVIHKCNKITHSNMLVTSLYTDRVGGHIQCFSRKSIKEFLARNGFSIEIVNDSTFGLEYLLKKPVFQSNSLKRILLSGLATFGYALSFLIGHQNHMTIYARRS